MKTSKLKIGILMMLVVVGLVVAANAVDAAYCAVKIGNFVKFDSFDVGQACFAFAVYAEPEPEAAAGWEEVGEVKAEALAWAYNQSPMYSCATGHGIAIAVAYANDISGDAFAYADVWPMRRPCSGYPIPM